MRLVYLALFLAGFAATACAAETIYDVRDFGAKGDGAILDTAAIQSAIDTCSLKGGGTVRVSPGRFLTGGLILKSHVRLYLDEGAVLLGSKLLSDYPVCIPKYRSYTDNYCERSLIYAENAEHCAVAGSGTIDGQGAGFDGSYKVRPYMIRMVSCQDVVLEGVHLENGAMWTVHFMDCEQVRASGVTIRSRCNKNNDGFDIDSCRNVRVSDCDISSGDDAIVLKSTSPRPTENITISNCIISSACNAIKTGTESNGGFKNVSIANCVVYDTHLSGVALELVDGGAMDGVVVSNITMRNTGNPIFVRLGNRARPHIEGGPIPGFGTLKNVTISHIDATAVNPTGCSITGLPDHPVENISLDHIRIRCPGGNNGKSVHVEVPEIPEKYPEYKMFGQLPAYGFFIRHARQVSLDHIDVGFEKDDLRPVLIAEDVDGLLLDQFQGMAANPAPGWMWFKDIRSARISGTVLSGTTGTFLRVDGARTADLWVHDNALGDTRRVADMGREVNRKALLMKENTRHRKVAAAR